MTLKPTTDTLMTNEAIVLAGGLGTRLRGVIGTYPKCMAEVNGRPFLHYVLRYLRQQGITRVILSLGFMSEVVTDWLAASPGYGLVVDWVIENEPLGTGGGIRLAMSIVTAPQVFVLNGDTFFDVNLDAMYSDHKSHGAETTVALKEMHDFDRYGCVRTDVAGNVVAFEEKQPMAVGDINGGIYLIDSHDFMARSLAMKCSFEKDYLEKSVAEGRFFAYRSGGYFIDIGIPEDYARVQVDFKTMFP